jgi:hypothetical protein
VEVSDLWAEFLLVEILLLAVLDLVAQEVL